MKVENFIVYCGLIGEPINEKTLIITPDTYPYKIDNIEFKM